MAQLPDLKSVRPAFELADGDSTPPMVTFEQLDGRSEPFRYEDLRSVRYIAEETLILRFDAAIVIVSGRNLLPVWRALRSHRLRRLRAGSHAEGLALEAGEPHITGITIRTAPRLKSRRIRPSVPIRLLA